LVVVDVAVPADVAVLVDVDWPAGLDWPFVAALLDGFFGGAAMP
jgi:hypothetical protein